jgi:lysophospholipase L1-like esterase
VSPGPHSPIFALRRWRSYRHWVRVFKADPVVPGDIVFLGDSITQAASWSDYFPGQPCRNWGIGGDDTKRVLRRLDSALDQPAKIFLMIGTNDIGNGVAEPTQLANVERILDVIAEQTPATKVYLESILPRTSEFVTRLRRVNAAYEAIASRRGIAFVDLTPLFADEAGVVRPEFCDDGLHLIEAGHVVWAEALRPLVLAT